MLPYLLKNTLNVKSDRTKQNNNKIPRLESQFNGVDRIVEIKQVQRFATHNKRDGVLVARSGTGAVDGHCSRPSFVLFHLGELKFVDDDFNLQYYKKS